MKRNNFLSLMLAAACLSGSATAQVMPCNTDEVHKKLHKDYPQIEGFEKQLELETKNFIARKQMADAILGRTTAGRSDTDYYDIPLVVHVMHDYGPELLADNKIYNLVAEMNRFYSLNYDTSGVLPAFKKYIGKARIRFHLATKDPYGNQTTGITHRYTYLTYGGDEQAKMDQWPPTSYLNIWFENVIGNRAAVGIIVAYAFKPSGGAGYPEGDGIISNYSFINDGLTTPGAKGGSIDHEVGHYFNLAHTFGGTNNPGTNRSGSCTDDDDVDDTPPTQGHLGGCALYDSVCATNYFKVYTDASGHTTLVDYPDTANEQNIMNYADCKVNFTKGQVERMHAALNSDIAGRNNLWSPTNLALTGALNASPDMAPMPDFAVKGGVSASANMFTRFTCPGTPLKFNNHSWRDTLTASSWNFTNGASNPAPAFTGTASATPVTTSFSEPGWVTVTLSATGNNTGTTTNTYPRAVFVADAAGKSPADFQMEFNTADTAKWPMFNYYNNTFKWELSNYGFYDASGIKYTGYDTRVVYNPMGGIVVAPTKGSPKGDYDDFYSTPVDLSGFPSTGPCNLNFYYSGATRSSTSTDINDRLEIHYSKDKGVTWQLLDTFTKRKLANKGAIASAYVPTSISDWVPATINIPSAGRTNYVVFRFRYKPNVGQDGTFSSGNNFYMDRIHVSNAPASLTTPDMDKLDIAVVPNPTNGEAFVVLKDAVGNTAQVAVTDITGKTVYTTSQGINNGETRIAIPAAAIAVKGIYLVQVTTGGQVSTRKLVVY